ncbi:MAG: GNAT family N-acetyltransferase [Gemmatimonadaceae bacterium]|nr:GNAT family N-acetyltransferase [Gemmatimonadaceae bacterium]
MSEVDVLALPRPVSALIVDDVVLRPFEPADIDALYAYRNDRELVSQLGGFSVGYSRSDLATWIERRRTVTDEILWAIADVSDDRCIGHVGLYRIDARVRRAEIAILIGERDRQGRGIGTAVTRAVVTYGFRELNLHRIALQVLATNDRAMRFYESLGFTREGSLRHHQFRDGAYVDMVLMSILDDEWATKFG